MKIDFDRIIEGEVGITSGSNLTPMDKGECKACMREACKQVLDEALVRMKEAHNNSGNDYFDETPILKIKEEL